MNREEAAKILAKELGDKLKRRIITEETHKQYLINNSDAFYQVSAQVYGDKFINQEYDSKFSQDITRKMLLKYTSLHDANYFFMTNIPLRKDDSHMSFIVTPYALIGKKDKQDLKKLFYKDVPNRILNAMNVFSIDNYIDTYQSYINLDNDYINLINRKIGKFLNFVSTIKYDHHEETLKKTFDNLGGIESLNSQLEKIKINARLSTNKHRIKMITVIDQNHIHRKNIQDVIDEINQKYNPPNLEELPKTKGFYNFVFNLPYEDQNIAFNKQILKLYSSYCDYNEIMRKEYSKGKHFQEYFGYLNDEPQQEVVNYLEDIPKRKLKHDSFLWSQGFENVKLDYMEFYNKDQNQFIKYFKGRSKDDKKTILRCIMNCDYTNKPIAEWLEENELDILREVSMDG